MAQGQSFNYPTLKPTPGKKSILNKANRIESLGDQATDADHADLLAEVEKFRDNQADGLANPEWHIAIMEGIAYGATREYDMAIVAVETSLQHADSDLFRGISYNNLSHNLRRSGRPSEAEAAARTAFSLLPSHGGVICNLSLALLANNKRKEAMGTLAVLIESSDIEDERTILSAHVRHEAEMRDLLELLCE